MMNDVTDLIFMHPALTEKDRNFAIKFTEANVKEKKKDLVHPVFSEINKKEVLNKIDLAIKAVFMHKIGLTKPPAPQEQEIEPEAALEEGGF